MKEVLSKQAVKIAKRAEEHESFINKVCLLSFVHAFNQKVSFFMLFYLYFLFYSILYFSSFMAIWVCDY